MLALILVFSITACNNTDTPTTSGNTPSDSNSPSTSPSGGDGTPSDSASPSNTGGDTTPSTSSPAPGGSDTFELALITDLGTIDDKSFNQGSWEGVVQYAEEFGISHKYYKPADQGDDAYLNAIDLAVQSGAKVIVTPGFLFEVPIYQAQDIYPNVKFVLLDGTPNNDDWSAGSPDYKIGANTVSVLYAEEQAGFLAGYATVMDGYRNLGYMGGIAVPAVIRFGHGYIQGAELAAQELGLSADAVKINYYYTGTFAPSPEISTMATAWYNDGVEVIFSCGGGICYSIFPSAENLDRKVIGVDVDQSGESATVLTSAMKLLTKSVYDCLTDFYAGSFPGGQQLIFSADNLGVGLPMDTSKFDSFTQADYDALYAKLVSGEIKVDNSTEIAPDAIPTTIVKVNNLG